MTDRILIRADDVGYCRAINYGIADSVWNGIIRSAGIMPNMPQAKHGIDLLKGSGVCFGQHTNLCLGKPCADPSKIPSLLDENGNLKSSRTYRAAWKEGKEITNLDEMVLEIEAQYHRYLELVGEKPHYFECHAVMDHNLFRGLEIVADKYDLPLLPMDFSGAGVPFGHSILHIYTGNMKSNAEDPFTCLQDAVRGNYAPGQCPMYVCHPGYVDAYLSTHSSMVEPRFQEVAMLTALETKQWLKDNHVRVVTYDEL